MDIATVTELQTNGEANIKTRDQRPNILLQDHLPIYITSTKVQIH